MEICRVLSLGLVDYLEAWDLQKTLVQGVVGGNEPNTLLILQHPHTYTIGRRGRREDVLLSDDDLSRVDVPVYSVDRGGEATYHGPGQLVAYPIVNLRPWGGPLKFVRTLEQVMVSTLADYGIAAGVKEGYTGVWVSNDKIGAIGLKVSRGVASHGLSLNVNTDLDYYRHVIPCGSPNIIVTSMQKILAQPIDMVGTAYTLQYHFGRLLKLKMVEADPAAVLAGTPTKAGSAI